MSPSTLNTYYNHWILVFFHLYSTTIAKQLMIMYDEVFMVSTKATYLLTTITKAFQTCGLFPFNPRVVLDKLQSAKEMLCTDIPLPNQLPPTPKNSSQVAQLVRRKKLELQQETDPETREGILEDLVGQLSRFGIAQEQDHQLVEQTFAQWREANSKNTKQDGGFKGDICCQEVRNLHPDKNS